MDININDNNQYILNKEVPFKEKLLKVNKFISSSYIFETYPFQSHTTSIYYSCTDLASSEDENEYKKYIIQFLYTDISKKKSNHDYEVSIQDQFVKKIQEQNYMFPDNPFTLKYLDYSSIYHPNYCTQILYEWRDIQANLYKLSEYLPHEKISLEFFYRLVSAFKQLQDKGILLGYINPLNLALESNKQFVFLHFQEFIYVEDYNKKNKKDAISVGDLYRQLIEKCENSWMIHECQEQFCSIPWEIQQYTRCLNNDDQEQFYQLWSGVQGVQNFKSGIWSLGYIFFMMLIISVQPDNMDKDVADFFYDQKVKDKFFGHLKEGMYMYDAVKEIDQIDYYQYQMWNYLKCNFGMYYEISPEAIDLMERMLQNRPCERISLDEIIQHKAFDKIRDEIKEQDEKFTYQFQVRNKEGKIVNEDEEQLNNQQFFQNNNQYNNDSSEQSSSDQNFQLQNELQVNSSLKMKPFKEFEIQFEKLQEIGKGTHGQIYELKQKEVQNQQNFNPFQKKRMCLKYLKAVTLEDKQEIEQELIILQMLQSHPNIISIDQIYFEESQYVYQYFLVMEKAEHDLQAEISLRRSISKPFLEQEIYQLIYQCVKALEFSTKNNIYHRDIKPANILVFKDKEFKWQTTYKLTDFGVANNDDDNQSSAGTILYMSPEMKFKFDTNQHIDIIYELSDLFSLGLTILQCANLSEPLDLINCNVEEEKLQAQINRVKNPKVRNILAKMLEFHPLNRATYPNIKHALNEIKI